MRPRRGLCKFLCPCFYLSVLCALWHFVLPRLAGYSPGPPYPRLSPAYLFVVKRVFSCYHNLKLS